VFDTKLYVSADEIGEIAKIYMTSGSTANSIYALSMQAISTNGEKRLVFYPVTKEGVIYDKALCEAPFDVWFNFRIEYYRYQYNDDYSEIQSILYSENDC
jgi:hypothetical protein